jgi:hypothetical protein
MDTPLENLTKFLNIGWGRRATLYLKEGATFKLMLDNKPFSLSKHDGKMQADQGSPPRHDMLFEISSSAIDYVSKANSQQDAQERLAQVIYHFTPERYARIRIETEPTEKARIDFYWQGFFFWARRMGFAS